MRREEETHPDSCFNKAHPNEMVFVLLARDPTAPATILAWVAERVKAGLNEINDRKIQDALDCAGIMESQRKSGKL